MEPISGSDGPLTEASAAAIARALDGHVARRVRFPERRPAAVMILLFERAGEPWLILTKRTESVATHKGQISFPGGSMDPEDEDLWDTAARETQEEIGLDPSRLVRLGQLDDYPTFSSGFVVTPFVATFDPPDAWHPNPDEIDEMIELPLRMLADIGRVETWDQNGIRFPMHIFEADRHYVWGVTAFILRRFLDVAGPALGYTEAGTMRDIAEQVVKELAMSDDRFDWVGVYWVENDDLVLGPYVGPHPEGHERIRIPEGVCGAVAAAGDTEVVPDVRQRPGHIACDLNTRSEVVAPIRRDGLVVGVLDVDSNTLDAFGPAEVAIIEEEAGRIASGRS